MNHSLCWLGLAKNRLRRLSSLQNLSSLAVLDISDNQISRRVAACFHKWTHMTHLQRP